VGDCALAAVTPTNSALAKINAIFFMFSLCF
jgi:hypothetical protein